jgi:hypothetical protein
VAAVATVTGEFVGPSALRASLRQAGEISSEPASATPLPAGPAPAEGGDPDPVEPAPEEGDAEGVRQ